MPALRPDYPQHTYKYQVAPIYQVHGDKVQTYWQTLYMHDELQFRVGNVKNPTWADVLTLIAMGGQQMFFVLQDQTPVAEFATDGMMGGTVRLHGSVWPELSFREMIDITRFVAETVCTWPGAAGVIGSVAENNRRALMLLYKSGYHKVGVVKKGSWYAGQHVNGVVVNYG